MTVPVPRDYFEAVVKAHDGAEGFNEVKVDLHKVVYLDSGPDAFEKTYDFYRDSINYVLWSVGIPVAEAYLKVHVFGDNGVHFDVVLRNDSGKTPEGGPVPLAAPSTVG